MQELQKRQVQSLGREGPLEQGIAILSSILALENPINRGASWAVHGVTKFGRDWALMDMSIPNSQSALFAVILSTQSVKRFYTPGANCLPKRVSGKEQTTEQTSALWLQELRNQGEAVDSI